MAAGAIDRDKLLDELDLRHDRLLSELAELNLRIEQALSQLKPSDPNVASSAKHAGQGGASRSS